MRRTLLLASGFAVLAGCQTPPQAAHATLAPRPQPPSARADREISVDVALATFDSAWSKIQKSYYDSTLKGLDWNAVRHELRPRVERAQTRAALRLVLMDMLGRLGDSHMAVLPREFASAAPNDDADGEHPGGVGIETRIIDRQLYVWRVDPDGSAARAGVRPGWVVESIDGASIDSAVAELRLVKDAALRRTLFVQVTARLQHRFDGPAASFVNAAFRDDKGAQRALTIERTPMAGQPVKLGHMPTFVVRASYERLENVPGSERCVGVMRFNYWLLPVMPVLTSAMSSFSSCAGIVIDLRGNVGGLAAMLSGVSGYMVDTAKSLAVVHARGQVLRYDVFPRRADASGQRVQPFAGPVAILIDPLTVSTSEVFAAGMRQVARGRTRLFGERSAGQALPAIASKLPTGDVLLHAVGDLRLADGTRVEGDGVRPDEEFPLRPADLLAGRDPAFDAALRWISRWNRAAAAP